MVDVFSVFDFDEGASGAADVLEVEAGFAELYLRVVAADALIQYEDLVGTVPSDFGALLLD